MLQERVTEVGMLYGFCITPPRTALWIEEMSSLVPPLPRDVKFKPAPLDPFGRPSVEERNDAGIHPWGVLSCRTAAGDISRRGVRLDVCAIARAGVRIHAHPRGPALRVGGTGGCVGILRTNPKYPNKSPKQIAT